MPDIYHLLPEGEMFSEFHGGAISRWVANVLRGDASGVVIAPDADETWKFPSDKVVVASGLKLYGRLLRITSHQIPWVFRRTLLRMIFRRALKRLRPGDIVWIHNRPEVAAALGAIVHKRASALILHMHNAHLKTTTAKILKSLQADGYIFVSEYLRNVSLAALKPRAMATVLYNGADGEVFRPREHGDVIVRDPMQVLFASRLVKDKGAHILVEALRTLQAQNVPIQGIIVGGVRFGVSDPDDYVTQLMRTAPDNLRFHPYCSGQELAQLFQEADVFCLPSVWHDPFPLAPLEAMATGLPVVATRSGGIPEALAFGGGVLVERNSVSELAEALRSLAADPVRRRKLSEEALASFQRHFRWSTVQANYRTIVEQLTHA
jgi:spore coat protein SA